MGAIQLSVSWLGFWFQGSGSALKVGLELPTAKPLSNVLSSKLMGAIPSGRLIYPGL